ncbi:MAG: phosphatase PAP2 family protein [Lachnospiraceae bacterium]|nr:phosphatase PAP2 family protein [Lachnospiraceae bacterium]
MLEWLLNLDGNILLFIQEYIRVPILTPFVKFITTLGNGGGIWILLTLIMLIIPKTRRVGCMMTAALIGTLLVNNILLKNLVARTRPYEVIAGLTYLVPKPGEYSFPSGHAGSSFAVACVMFRELPKKYGIPALVLAILIALSRLYVGVHYPSDVLFGIISGIAISYAAVAVVEWIDKLKNKNSEEME